MARDQRKPFHDDPQRAVAALTLGMVRRVDQRNARTRERSIRETILCFQLPLTGEATEEVGWTDFEVSFDQHFHYSPGTQDSDLDVPTVGFGAELQGNPVMLSAHVVAWKRDADNDAIVTGASLRVGAHAPLQPEPVSFGGTLHLTFTGYATLFEDETELTE